MENNTTKPVEHEAPKGPRELPPLPSTKEPPPKTTPTAAPPPRQSFAERKHSRYRSRQQPSLEPVIEGDSRLLRDVRDLPPGDTRPTRRLSKPDLAKRRSEYFEDAFQDKDVNLVRDKVRSESMVVAELKTNVTIPDEFAFIMELSRHLSERYHRPLSSITVTLEHRICMFLGGSFAPSYSISISALPSQIQTATNKRNLLLLQMHLERTLKVFPTRGVVRYLPVAEECFGWNGRTIAGEMAEALNRTSPEQSGSPVRRRRTLPTIPVRRLQSSATPNAPDSVDRSAEQIRDTQDVGQFEDQAKPENDKKVRTKKSFIHTLFQRPPKPSSELPAGEGGRSSASTKGRHRRVTSAG